MSPTNQRPQRHNERFPSTPSPSSSVNLSRNFLRGYNGNKKENSKYEIEICILKREIGGIHYRSHIEMCENFHVKTTSEFLSPLKNCITFQTLFQQWKF
ncbi:hypothetical protein T05_11271 [Trichinella murrelli]|uniref:Uncharacterized protein n=1 Tax=Trichinella murrelli TaxID=144512 RepID=A0A0V0TCJ7_9BILA|nr:hypothetical protein T05_11271 [Trichinella murrelli]